MKVIAWSRCLMLAIFVASLVACMAAGCSEDKECPTVVCPDLIYEAEYGWNCGVGINCQDVFDIEFKAETVVNLAATDVTGGSVLQIALYAPGVTPGGTNLLTGSSNEYRCGFVSGCANNEHGQWITDFAVPSAGVYRFAVTRHWGDSCGGSGTYKLKIIANKSFTFVGQTVNDQASAAPGWECP